MNTDACDVVMRIPKQAWVICTGKASTSDGPTERLFAVLPHTI